MEYELLSTSIIRKETVENWLDNPIKSISDKLFLDGCTRHFPSHMFNKTMYLVYNGVLRQFKIRKEFIFPFNYCYCVGESKFSSSRVRNVYLIDVAGVGELYIRANMWRYAFIFHIYNSVEDFKNGTPIDQSTTSVCVNGNKLNELYHKYCSLSNGIAYRYVWNGVRAISKYWNTNISLFFTYDGKKYSLPCELDFIEYEGYPTKEMCESDNAIQVACFADDDEEKEFEVTATQVMSRTYKVKAKNFDSACNKVTELLDDNPLVPKEDGNHIEFL